MKTFPIRILLASWLAVWAGTPASTVAAPENPALAPETSVAQNLVDLVMKVERYRWFANFGTTTRSINADFQLDGHQTTLDWKRYVDQQSGRGDVGLYRGAGDTVHYNDGYVGPSSTYSGTGAAGGYVNSTGQISSHPLGDTGGRWNRVLSFHSEGYGYGSSLGQYTVNTSDSDVGVGPYFQWGYHVMSVDSVLINFVTGSSYISTDHSSGDQMVAKLSVMEDHNRYTYRYDYTADSAYPLPIPGAVAGSDQVIITDPTAITGGIVPFPGAGYQAARESESSSSSMATRFYAMSRADLDVNLSEIPVGFEIGREIGPVDLYVVGGTTLNVIDYNLTNSVAWYRAGSSTPITRQQWRDSGTPVRVGFYSGFAMKVPLKRDGRIYLESHGTYRWVDPVHASAGIADVEIDPSSWEAGVGIVIIIN